MMRRRIQHKIRNLCYRRISARRHNTETSAGSDAGCEIARKGEWIGDMLDSMEGTNHVVFFGVRHGVLGDCLVPDVRLGANCTFF
jgi:hypothetical protein